MKFIWLFLLKFGVSYLEYYENVFFEIIAVPMYICGVVLGYDILLHLKSMHGASCHVYVDYVYKYYCVSESDELLFRSCILTISNDCLI